jgi:hypothetical protein
MKATHYITIEEEESLYEQALDNFKLRDYVTLLVHSSLKRGDGRVGQETGVRDHAISIGAEKHWVLDDNIDDFYRLNRNKRIRVESGAIFKAAEDFVDRYEKCRYSLDHDIDSLLQQIVFRRYVKNTRIYSTLLISNNCKHRWRGRYNEDTDICLRVLKDGDCTIQFNAFLQGKAATQTVKGGNTEEFTS